MWSASLLFTLPLSLALTLLFAMRTRRISARTRHKILYTLLCFFVFSEILKHLLALRTGTHTAMYYPFHYSTTYYFSIALYLSENRRMRHFGACTLYVGGSLLFLCMILAPRAIVGDTAQLFADWFRVHSFFYHVFVLFVFFVMLFNHDYTPRPTDVWRYLAFLLFWSFFALPAAHVFGANYAGLLSSFIGVLEAFRLRYGNALYLGLYLVLALAFASLSIGIYCALRKKHPSGH
ncbi:MAG: hypothetical protein E7624_08780 [Ruminococcaceae bacterium]|nr:hypothetical protein [Oscillospiraceae bacterium]